MTPPRRRSVLDLSHPVEHGTRTTGAGARHLLRGLGSSPVRALAVLEG